MNDNNNEEEVDYELCKEGCRCKLHFSPELLKVPAPNPKQAQCKNKRCKREGCNCK